MKALTITFSLAILAGVAWSQETKPIGVSIRAGQFRPQARDARDRSKVWIMGGLDVRLKDLKYEGVESNYLTLSVDYAKQSRFQTIPVVVNYVSRRNEWYYFGGLGASSTTVPRVVGLETKKDKSIELAYQFGVGYDFQHGKSPLFGEAKFMGNGQSKLNGFSVMIGVRL